MTFRDYLERRRIGDEGVREFLELRDPALLERRSWADMMWAFRADGAEDSYIARARRLHLNTAVPFKRWISGSFRPIPAVGRNLSA